MTEIEAIKVLKEYDDCAGLMVHIDHRTCVKAIEALEKQVPKKVDIQQWIYTKCECGYEFSEHYGDGYYSIPYDKQTNYCPYCGQKLDWQ